MTYDDFKSTISAEAPPQGVSQALQALWWDTKGDWNKAHEAVQAKDDAAGAWVHAYLHRKEGDVSNAGYWYRKAGKPAASGSLVEEWDNIAQALLN